MVKTLIENANSRELNISWVHIQSMAENKIVKVLIKI